MSDQNNFDTDEHLKEIYKDINENKLGEAVEKIKKHLHNVENIPLDIAITGESGTGKSTFINSIRGLQDGDEGAAETGDVETTDKPTPYRHPNVKNVTYWDLPGIGTPKFHAATYLEDVDFKRYDFFIILASERFKENDVFLANAIHDMKKNFYFVRSKIDNDVRANNRRTHSDTEEDVLKRIREDCVKKLEKAGIKNPHVFLVSSFSPGKFDFTRLLENLNRDLPGEKRSVLLRALPNISSETIQAKKRELSNQISLGFLHFCAEGECFNVFKFNDRYTLANEIKSYLHEFGLDAEAFKNLSKQSGKTVSELKGLMKSAFVKNEVTTNFVSAELRRREGIGYVVKTAILFMVDGLIPFGSLPVGAEESCKLLLSVLKEFAEDAETTLEVAIQCLDN